MAAYVIANVRVTSPQQYEQYKGLSTRAIQAHGAKVLVRGGATAVLEGDWRPERMVVLEFPDGEAARRFYDSPEYREARAAREGAAVMSMVLVDGI